MCRRCRKAGATNQQILLALAEGTGGFTIYNTNDLLGGLDRIAQEANQFYVLGYVPQATPEGSCHALKVKLNRGGMEVRSRSGYCNTRPVNPLDGKPLEKQMEDRAAGSQPGAIHGTMQAPYFYTAPNIARVNLAMQIPGDSVVFNKDKGKYHAVVNVLGIAYKPDGSTGARFNDVLNLDLEKDQWKEFTKGPYRYQNQFDAAPGNYKLTVVLSSGGDAFGKFETPLQIDPYDGKKFTLGGVVLSTFLQPLTAISTEVDAALLEDRTPLIVKGMQVNPAADYRFKKTDNVVLYSEIYEPLAQIGESSDGGRGLPHFRQGDEQRGVLHRRRVHAGLHSEGQSRGSVWDESAGEGSPGGQLPPGAAGRGCVAKPGAAAGNGVRPERLAPGADLREPRLLAATFPREPG